MEKLKDLLDCIKREVRIAELLIELNDTYLLSTPLEHIHEYSQKIIDDYCIVGLKKDPPPTPPISAHGASTSQLANDCHRPRWGD
ncbi:hypothetical protein ACFLYM_00215 [Chloroflexota bacterium]